MPVFLLLCTVLATLLLTWGVIYSFRKSKLDKNEIEQFQKDKIKLLSFIRERSIKVSKFDIMFKLEKFSRDLKPLVKSCKEDGFITETGDHVKITTFGKEYYDRFIISSQAVSGEKNGKNKITR